MWATGRLSVPAGIVFLCTLLAPRVAYSPHTQGCWPSWSMQNDDTAAVHRVRKICSAKLAPVSRRANTDRGSFGDLKTDDTSFDEPCSGLVLQSTCLTVSFSSCTGELLSLSRRNPRNGSSASDILGHAIDAPDNGPFALWMKHPHHGLQPTHLTMGQMLLTRAIAAAPAKAVA